MATSPTAAANPAAPATPQKKKDESFLDKLGTLGRKKKVKEAQDLEIEGRNAIESPTSPMLPDVGPEFYSMENNEERSMLDPDCQNDAKLLELKTVRGSHDLVKGLSTEQLKYAFKLLVRDYRAVMWSQQHREDLADSRNKEKLTLFADLQVKKMMVDWINDELAEFRILVKDIEEDLFDGQIIQKLVEKMQGIKMEVPEVTQTETGQKQKLRVILDTINNLLQLAPATCYLKWSVDSIHGKKIVSILHLLVALARHYRAPLRLPDNVTATMIVVQKRDGILLPKKVIEEITGTNDDIGARFERDAFDTLFDHAPDKLNVVKKSLINFVNKHLNKINLEVTDLDSQFHDGVYLVLLLGLLEGYFVPLYSFHLTPTTFEQKVHNVHFAYELMVDAGLPKPKTRAEDIVNQDLKSTLRVLYNLFTKYKGIS